MLSTVLFWSALVACLGLGFVFFRDLGDVSQMLLKVKRSHMLRAVRHEKAIVATGSALALVVVLAHLGLGAGSAWVFWPSMAVILLFYGFPLIWVHLGLRNQQGKASYVSIEQARKALNPDTSMLVIEANGQARAHSDYDLSRPHLASDKQGLAGESNLVMTYCAMANLGMGLKAELDGRSLDLEVLAQHGNNLILRDRETQQPIQQIYGRQACDENSQGQCDLAAGRTGMGHWPTYRMSFRAFEKAFPQGQVFLNKPASNPLLRLFDAMIDAVFTVKLAQHRRENQPVMDNMTHYDERLLNKTLVWAVEINGDAVAYTEDFIFEQDNLVNAHVGGRDLVIAYDTKRESLGFWYNDSGKPVSQIDFWGVSDQGQLERVESLRPGMFWHVWAEFFPHTDINRATRVQLKAVA